MINFWRPGWVGPGRGTGLATSPFPRPARRTRRACLHATGAPRVLPAGRRRWCLSGRCPRGRDLAAAVAVAGHSDAGSAGEHDSVAGEFPGSGQAESAAKLWPAQQGVFVGPPGDIRVHRGLVQHPPPAFQPRLPQPYRVRSHRLRPVHRRSSSLTKINTSTLSVETGQAQPPLPERRV